MVKLPGWEELGQAPRVDGGRAIGSYDATQVARAGVNLGKAVGAVGEATAEYGLEENRFEYHQAHSEHLTNKIETYGALKADTDYATMGDRYGKGIDKINSDAAARISDPVMRERFLTDTKSDVAQYKLNVTEHARTLQNHALDGYDLQQGDRYLDLMSKAPDEGTRAQLVQQRNNDVDALVQRGVLTPEQAFGRKKQFAERWAATDGYMRIDKDPQGFINTLQAKPGSDASLVERIVQVESGGDPHSRAATTSAYGAAQFLASREGGDTTWRDLLAKNHPDLVAGKNLDEINALRADPGLAREMLGKIVEQNRGILTRNGLEATPGALYLSHFLGPKSAVALLQASPGQPIADVLSKAVGPDMARQMVAANPEVLGGKLAGTVKDWADRKMGGATPGAGTIYDFLPADARERMLAHAQQQVQKQTVNDLTGFKQRWQDTVAEGHRNPDGPANPMTLEEFAHALGAARAPAAYKSYQNELQLAADVHRVADMSPDEQRQLYDKYTPAPGAEGFADAAKRQDVIEKAIVNVAKERQPAFKARWTDTLAEADRNPDGPANPMTLEEFRRALGDKAAPAAFEAYQNQLQLAADIHKVPGASAAEQQRLREGYTPAPGAEGYADAAKRQEVMDKAIAQVAKGREGPLKARWQETVAEAYRNPDGPLRPMTLAEFSHAMGAEKGAAAFASYQDELKLAADIHAAPAKSPAELQALREGYTPKPGAEGFIEGAKRQDTIEKAVAQVAKERQHPADFAVQRLPAARDAWNEFNSTIADPSVPPEEKADAARTFATKTLLAQQRVDIPEDQRTILPQSYVDGISKRIAAAADSDDPQKRIGLVAQIDYEAKLWGEHWPAVMHQLAPTAQPIVRAIAAGADPIAMTRILNLGKDENPAKILKEQNEVKFRDVTKELNDAMAPFAKTLVGRQMDRDFPAYYGLAEKLSALYVRDGKSAGDAAKAAFAALVGNRYEFRDTWRMPKSSGVEADDIQKGTLAARNALRADAGGGNLLEQARTQYPILKNLDIGFKMSEGKAPFMLEHWGPGMTESIPGVDRPKEFPNDKFGIEVYDKKTRPIDILGDVVSHRLVESDPKLKAAYSDFKNSIEPWQEDILHEQYEYAKKNLSETRPFEDWKSVSGVPAYFRGHPFQQWGDDSKRMYTPGQIKKLDAMMGYLSAGGRSAGAAGNPLAGVKPAVNDIGLEDNRSDSLAKFARDGTFVTAPDNSGLNLIYGDKAVRGADGKPVFLSWQQLEQMGKGYVRPAPVSRQLPGFN